MTGSGTKQHTAPPPAPRWEIANPPATGVVEALEAGLSLPKAMCSALVARGLDSVESAKAFLRPELASLHPPDHLRDIETACDRILHAVDVGERILVHGDYDVDGVSGAALLTAWIRTLGGDVEPFVPHRLKHGYDFGVGGLDHASSCNASLIVTVDCGVKAGATVNEARSRGMDVVITDHHTPGPELPSAIAVVNPSRSDCAYPNPGLSGTGVAFKLCQMLAEKRRIEFDVLLPYLDLVALASIADLVPLTGENRVLVRYGLRALERTERPGLAALLRHTGLADRRLDAGQVGFMLAPPINAAGRVQDARLGLDLLLETDADRADEQAAALVTINRERQAEDRRTLDQAVERLSEEFDPERDYGVVVAGDGWHPGVIGIVASRLVERLYRPVVVVSLDGDSGRGSARSIRGFDLLAAVREAGDWLERYGGHKQAAGMDILRRNVDGFRTAFNDAARAVLDEHLLRPQVRVDLEITLDGVSDELERYLWYAGPFGVGNPRPTFLSRGCELVEPPALAGNGHLRLRLRQNGRELKAIGFSLGRRIDPATLGTGPVDVAYQVRRNWFRGRGQVELRLVDVRRSGGDS